MRKIWLPLLALMFLSACAEMELASHVAKQVPIPDEQQSVGYYKIGTPYKIHGKWYKPQETFSFTQTGTASWYGPNFHGKKTANGETFDMYEMTAAHRTLQMPSIARVTNLENGRSVVVRINDRGPYSKGRVLDLSKKAAQELGFIGNGTTQVKIQVLGPESRQVAALAKQGIATTKTELAYNNRMPQISAPPIPSAKPLAAPVQQALAGNKIYVQAGAFGDVNSAQRLAGTLQNYAPTKISEQNSLYKVRLGPFADKAHAQTVLAQMTQSGKAQGFIVVSD